MNKQPDKLTVDDLAIAAGMAYAAYAGSVDEKGIYAAVKAVLRYTDMVIVDGKISHLSCYAQSNKESGDG